MIAGRRAFGGIAFVLVFALLVGYGRAVPAYAAPTRVRVHSVLDRGTVICEGVRRVRYPGIDALEVARKGEPGDALGDEASR